MQLHDGIPQKLLWFGKVKRHTLYRNSHGAYEPLFVPEYALVLPIPFPIKAFSVNNDSYGWGWCCIAIRIKTGICVRREIRQLVRG